MTGKPRKRWTIQVTAEDIARARRNDSYLCVVAQAIARAIPDAKRIEVDTQTIRFTRGDQRYVFVTPYVVMGYVIAFDAGDDIKPFSFQLRDPAKVQTIRRTAAGKAVAAAAVRARRNAPAATKERAAGDARAAYAAAAEQAGDAPRTISSGGRKAPPRVFKQRRRAYGHRLLRINQQDART